MGSLLKNIKLARYTAKEVMIHLQKNGELKRKQYAKYLKIQYKIAAETYSLLNADDDDCSRNKLTLNQTKLTMPVQLTKSEVSMMSNSFDETSYLTEAWHFYQKDIMLKSFDKHHPVHISKKRNNPPLKISRAEESRNANHVSNKTILTATNNDVLQSQALTQTNVIAASGLTIPTQSFSNSEKSTPLCIQILKWAQEGKLILN